MPKGTRRGKRKQQEEVVLTPEQLFAQYVALKKATRCILELEDEYKIYVRLTKDFRELGERAEQAPFEGSDQCEVLSEECRCMAEELKAKLPEHKENISRTVTTTMKEQEKKSGVRKGKGKWIALVLLVLAVAAGICYKSTPTRYIIAGIEKSLSMKKYAMESYHSLGDYKDSREKTKEAMYEYAVSLQEKERWDEARDFFHRLAKQGYQDSETRAFALEKQIMAETEPGETMRFGNSNWILLEKKDGKALLARYKTIRGKQREDDPVPGELYEDERKNVTWDQSSLRTYLNNGFMQDEFSLTEQNAIQDTALEHADNKWYGTGGGADTVDKIFILSADEIGRYADILKDKVKSLRLRNPGLTRDSTAYVSPLKEVVYYGFPVDQKGVYNRPVLWVSYEN